MLTCSTDRTADLQRLLMETIASLHQNRILCRLRSCHAKVKSNFAKRRPARPKILPALAESFEEQTLRGKDLSALASDVKDLANLSTKLESLQSTVAASTPGLQILLSILQTTHHLLYNSDFHLLELSEPLRLSLAKLNRYVSACVDLIRAARRYSFFANLTVEVVKFEPVAHVHYTPLHEDFFESLIARLSLNTTPAALLSSFNFQSRGAHEHKRSRAAQALWKLINVDCAVHAEMQLLFHYEFHAPRGLMPRVICATKSACYLCNLFFSLHGRFYIPSTHGRVYEKWTLPDRVVEVRDSRLNKSHSEFLSSSNRSR
jgi:hypothetical protein